MSDAHAAPAGHHHHLLLCFSADGGVAFYPMTADPDDLARRFAQLVRVLVETPSAIACAAGAHDDGARA